MPPNIFTYATSELSQDAFICWLVACAQDDEDSLRECGTEFIRRLWNHGRGTTSAKTCTITDVIEPERQHGKSKFEKTLDKIVELRGSHYSVSLPSLEDSGSHGFIRLNFAQRGGMDSRGQFKFITILEIHPTLRVGLEVLGQTQCRPAPPAPPVPLVIPAQAGIQ